MGINLLPQVNVKQKKQFKIKTGLFFAFAVWVTIAILTTAGFYLYKGIAVTDLAHEKSQYRKTISELKGISKQVQDYYNIAYKSLVLTYVSNKKYKPSVVVNYMDKQVKGRGKINNYYIDASGVVKVSIEARDYSSAVHIWHSLLENEKIIEELNLNSFGETEEGRVNFTLKGRLNLKELYTNYGEK